jgi:CO/xanthine dehydrogenase FAD-binding subunit
MARQRLIERSPVVSEHWPLLHEAVRHIGHVHIRNRGTVGGSLAHADPAAELPAAMLALEAEMVARNQRGARTVRANEFFVSHFTTALDPDELLEGVRLPPLPQGTGCAYQELSRRYGDFAIVGVAALLALHDGLISRARLAFAGAGPTPLRTLRAEELLVGQPPDERLFQAASVRAVSEIEPDSDIHADASYRREVAAVLMRRALSAAYERATEDGGAASSSGRGLG